MESIPVSITPSKSATSGSAISQTAEVKVLPKADTPSTPSAVRSLEFGLERKRPRSKDFSEGSIEIQPSEKALNIGSMALSKFQISNGAEYISEVISQKEWGAAQTVKLPPYPQALKDFLAGDCEIWPGKKRSATHIVVPLFPQVGIDGSPVPSTLDSLDQLDKSSGGPGFIYVWDKTPNNIPAENEFHYAVMTNDVIPGSRYSSYDDQLRLLPAGYEVPGVFDAARAILWTNRRAGRRYLSDKPMTFTRCKEMIEDYQLVVGGFGPSGLAVYGHYYDSEYVGIVGWRKF